MVRCCKDLGVASELWDPRWVRRYLDTYTRETFVEHIVTKKKKKIVLRKDDRVRPPFRETKFGNGTGAFTPSS
jgi:Mitochondrial genome maintenance MGM101